MADTRVVVCGVMGQSPFAGVTWQVLHYLEGFRRLGLDVTYLEDTGEWPYDPLSNVVSAVPTYTVGYLKAALARCGMDDHWFYRFAPEDGAVYGGTERELADVLASADVLVNVTGATVLRDEHLQIPTRVYLETDPVLPEIEIAQGAPFTVAQFDAHTHIATFGENFGAPDCGVPLGEYSYIPTRQPVVVDWWARHQPVASDAAFTTIASWRQTGKDVTWRGRTYTWSKHVEFEKMLDLPARTHAPFVLALSGAGPDDLELLARSGWSTVDALQLSGDPDRYRQFVRTSRGEFTVAKEQNVALRSGWFSDRSACYLAAGLPVVTQETGFSNVLPSGVGLFGFATVDEAAEALEAVTANPTLHAARASEIARECFEATTVLKDLLTAVGATP